MKISTYLLAKTCSAAAFVVAATTAAAAPPIGDSQGVVSAVRVRPLSGSVQSFEVWFSQVQNDRWGCLAGGSIVVYDNGYGVSAQSFKQIFAIALLAQQTGKPLALDSAGTNPCGNVNMGWMIAS